MSISSNFYIFFNIVWRLFDYYILRNIHTARERSGKLPLCPNCAACGIMCKLVCLQSFAQACLRTLCVAVRSVPEALWRQWSETLAESAAMETRECDALLEKLYDQMEREMQVNFSPDSGKKHCCVSCSLYGLSGVNVLQQFHCSKKLQLERENESNA